MAKAVPLFSGSKGNSYFLGTATQGVLIDAGRSCKQIENALLTNSIDPRTYNRCGIYYPRAYRPLQCRKSACITL